MSYVYPIASNAQVDVGLSEEIAFHSPDIVPYQPSLLSADHSNQVSLAAFGCPKLLHRNYLSYPYHDNSVVWDHKLSRRQENNKYKEFQLRYDAYIPKSILLPMLKTSNSSNNIPPVKRQGNVLKTTLWKDNFYLFYPKGHIPQQIAVSMINTSNDSVLSSDANCSVVETGCEIKQIAGFGGNSIYERFVVARGEYTSTYAVLEDTYSDANFELKKLHTVKLPYLLNDLALNPHALDLQTAYISDDGSVYSWNAEDLVMECLVSQSRSPWLFCEYGAHPCSLWVANHSCVRTLDFREVNNSSSSIGESIFEIEDNCEEIIYGLLRHPDDPYILTINTSSGVNIIDSRLTNKAIISWSHGSAYSKEHYSGPMVIARTSLDSSSERDLILTGSHTLLKTTARSFGRVSIKEEDIILHPLRSEAGSSESIQPIVSLDVPLDLRVPEFSSDAYLTGMGFIPIHGNPSGVIGGIFQSTNIGDIFYQEIGIKEQDHTVPDGIQESLPCGIVCHPNDSMIDNSCKLPLSSDAYQREKDDDTIDKYEFLHVEAIAEEQVTINMNKSTSIGELENLVQNASDEILSFIYPSTTFAKLKSMIEKKYKVIVDSSNLIRILEEWKDIRIDYWNTRCFNSDSVIHPTSENNSFPWDKSICKCSETSNSMPCDSTSCIIPHALCITVRNRIPSKLNNIPETGDYKYIIEELERDYTLDCESL